MRMRATRTSRCEIVLEQFIIDEQRPVHVCKEQNDLVVRAGRRLSRWFGDIRLDTRNILCETNSFSGVLHASDAVFAEALCKNFLIGHIDLLPLNRQLSDGGLCNSDHTILPPRLNRLWIEESPQR